MLQNRTTGKNLKAWLNIFLPGLNFEKNDLFRPMHTFFGHNLAIILANRTDIFCGNSENYYLSIAGVKSMLWHLIADIDVLGPFWRENGRGRHAGA